MIDLFEKVIKAVVLVIGTIILFVSLKKIYKNKKIFQYYFYLIFYIFFVFPLLLNFLFPNHYYYSFVRANEGMANPTANLIYDVFCLVVMLFIFISARRAKTKAFKIKYNKNVIRACTIIMVVVMLYTIATNGIANLIPYGSGYKGIANINEVLMGCGTISFLVILTSRKHISTKHFIFVLLLELAFCWFVGKRYIIAETLIISFIVLVLTNQITGKQFIILCGIGAIGLIAFSVIYAVVLKGNFSSLSDYLMIDFSRQYTLVYQIHCDLIGKEISVNKYDAINYIITFFVPRSVWADKPYPFVNQLTYSLISWSDVPSNENVGWATTCSIFSDFFDSFKYLGFVMVLIIFALLFKAINKTNKAHYATLFAYLTIRLITVQLSSAIIQIVVCFIIVFVVDRIFEARKKKIKLRRVIKRTVLVQN